MKKERTVVRTITAEVDLSVAVWLDKQKQSRGVAKQYHVNEALKAYIGKNNGAR
jgi:hypothetical protein